MVETEQTTPAPEVASALATIDWEIEQARAAETRAGWTPWVLAASLAAVAWALLAQPALFLTDLTRLSLQYATICAAVGLSELLGITLPPHNRQQRAGRFSLAFAFMSRSSMVVVLAQTAILYWIFWSNRSSLHGGTVAAGFYAFCALATALGLAGSFTRLPLPLKKKRGNRVGELLGVAIVPVGAGSALYAGGGWVLHDLVLNGDAALAAMKVAGLLAAASLIVTQAVKQPGPAALNERLIALRRDLAYGRISAHEALSQADIAVDGLRLADVFQEDLAGLLKLAEEYTQLVHTAEVSLVATVRAKEVAEATHPPDETAVATHVACLANTTRLSTDHQKKVDDYRVRVKSFERRLAAVKSDESATDANALSKKLAETVVDPINKAAANFIKRMEALSEVVKPKLLGASGQVPASVTVLAKSEPSPSVAVTSEVKTLEAAHVEEEEESRRDAVRGEGAPELPAAADPTPTAE